MAGTGEGGELNLLVVVVDLVCLVDPNPTTACDLHNSTPHFLHVVLLQLCLKLFSVRVFTVLNSLHSLKALFLSLSRPFWLLTESGLQSKQSCRASSVSRVHLLTILL